MTKSKLETGGISSSWGYNHRTINKRVNGEQKQPGDQITITGETYIYAIWENIPAQHVHDYGTAWKTDANEHWNECDCGDKANKASHTDSNNDGECDTCEYQMTNGGGNTETPDNPNNTPDDPSDDKDGLSAGAIVGIVIGSVAVAGVGGFALFWFVIKKKSFADLIAVFKKK